jgi:hypothetical protein
LFLVSFLSAYGYGIESLLNSVSLFFGGDTGTSLAKEAQII